MTSNSNLKNQIRSRQAATGEKYNAARQAVLAYAHLEMTDGKRPRVLDDMTWIHVNMNAWDRPWWSEQSGKFNVAAADKTGECWIDTATGDEIILVHDDGDGPTETPRAGVSQFRIFRHHPATGSTWELTEMILPALTSGGRFMTENVRGAFGRDHESDSCTALISEVLGARELDDVAAVALPS